MLFSGYLSYTKILANSCTSGVCGQTIASIPVCIYGFIMHLAVFIFSVLVIKAKK